MFLLTLTLNAQSIISPSIGIDYTKMQDPEWTLLDYYTINSSKSNFLSLNGNVSFEKYLNAKLTLGFNASISLKSFVGIHPGPTSVSFQKVTYHFFKGSILLKYYPIKNIYFGVGPNQNYTFNSKLEKRIKLDGSSKSNGLDFLLGGIYRNCFIECRYSHGLEKERMINTLTILKTLHSFSATIGYRFDISKKKNRKKN